eukprot:gene10740-13142_t
MKARIKWVEERTFVGESGSGHKIVLGTASGPEGRTPGPSPMELMLIGAGGCSAYDVVHILEKGREPVEDCSVELDADRAEVLARARALGVQRQVLMGVTRGNWQRIWELATTKDDLYA